MKRIVILSINAKYVHSSLAAWFIAAGVLKFAKSEYLLKVVETTINQSLDSILSQALESEPEIIGISTYIWNSQVVKSLIPIIKDRLPGALIVLGGPEVSFDGEAWIKSGADFVLKGEGEESFAQLLDCIVSGDGFERVQGLVSGKISNETAYPELTPPSPYSDEYFDALKGRIAYIETSRGCPFSCTFCLSGVSKLRFFDLENSKKQITRLVQSGTRTIKFVDRTFNCNKERAYELFEFILNLDTQCCFHFEVAADLFDDETLLLLSKMPPGRVQLEIGLQSFHNPTLNSIRRKTDTKRVQKNIRAILSHSNIHTHIDLIAGLPCETPDIFKMSFNTAYSLSAHTLQLGFLKLLKGSELCEKAKEYEMVFSPDPPYEIHKNKWMSEEDLKVIKTVENALEHTYNKGRFLRTLNYALCVSGLDPFDFYYKLGLFVQNHAMRLDDYANEIFLFLSDLQGIDKNKLRDEMVCDFLEMSKGKNMPKCLFLHGDKRTLNESAQQILARKPAREQTALLTDGRGVFVDSHSRDKVSGLYKIYYI